MGMKSFSITLVALGAMVFLPPAARAQDGASDRIQAALSKMRQLREGKAPAAPAGTAHETGADESASVAAGTSTAPSGGTLERFTVNAQYRGAVKKSFMDLGGGSVRCRTLAPDRFEVTLAAKVRHPEKDNESIEFSIRREFTLEGSRVKILSEDNTMNDTASKYKEKILGAVCLAYLIKWRSPQSDTGAMSGQSYQIGDKNYALAYAAVKGILEVSLSDQDGKVAKFFLKPSEHGVRPIDRFRIFTRDDVVISFVVS